ncbi:MAG: hypothetical protein A2297_05620 [Elusimicrobia bacterium RIFOXYB2_FULL_48_7]|nr:MAG: hypothetical protein A2297_05620 [Elusimicrobia bacterium RIFOXYB2_FULL_48_7]
MKKTGILFFSLLFFNHPAFALGLHLGMAVAVRSQVNELDKKAVEKILANAGLPGNLFASGWLSGTAARGAAIASAPVVIKDSFGTRKNAVTDAQGEYSIDITGLYPPLLLNAAGGTTMYFSIAFSTGVCNIHPVTDLVLRAYFKSSMNISSNLDSAFSDNFISLLPLPPEETINSLKGVITQQAAPVLARAGIADGSFDIISSAFDADGTGFDQAIEELGITGTTDYSRVIVTDLITGIVLSTITPSSDGSVSPDAPFGLTAAEVSSNSISIAWLVSGSSGIAGYTVFRDGALRASVSETTFKDTGLTQGTQYTYTVSAFTWTGTNSAQSDSLSVTTSGTPPPPQTAPSAPSSVSFSAGNASASLSWASVSGASTYNIYWSNSPAMTKTTGTKITSATSTYTLNGLTNGATYYAAVTAVNSYGESPLSSVAGACPSAGAVPFHVDINITRGTAIFPNKYTSWHTGGTATSCYFAYPDGWTVGGSELTNWVPLPPGWTVGGAAMTNYLPIPPGWTFAGAAMTNYVGVAPGWHVGGAAMTNYYAYPDDSLTTLEIRYEDPNWLGMFQVLQQNGTLSDDELANLIIAYYYTLHQK